MELRRKDIFFISCLYGLIVASANVVGVLIPNIFEASNIAQFQIDNWLLFLNSHPHYDSLQYVTFVIPTILCCLYVFTNNVKIKSRIINLPIAYSTIGISGWITYLVLEIILILVGKAEGFDINAKSVLEVSILTIMFEALVTFTLSYFITETIHRLYVLPKFFSDGKLYQYPGTIQPSTKFLFSVNYFSVTLFPILNLFILLFSLKEKYNFTLNSDSFMIFFISIAIGLVITFLINSYFEKPLKRFKRRIEKIKEGDYKSKINFIANDLFGELADTINEMTESIDQKTQKIFQIQNSIITGMATMVESRDNSTGGHIKRTSDCVRIFSEHLKSVDEYKNIPDSFFQNVTKAAPMHDLGKIAVDDAILRKPGKFSEDEYEKMKSHSKEGARIVENVLSSVDDIEFKQIAINVAHYHHEKWNGQGYPEKIARTEIPLEARIMALADVFDALVSKRCYKDSFSYDKAFKIIEEDLGTHFDPQLGLEFIKCRSRLEELYSSY